jgi:uncharacterized protein YcfL
VAGLPAAGAAAARGHGEAGPRWCQGWPPPCSSWTTAWPPCLQLCSAPACSRSTSSSRAQQHLVAALSGLAAGTATQTPSKRSTATAIPKLYSNRVATVQEAYQEYWWVHAACKVQLTCNCHVCVTGVEAAVCQTWIFGALCCGWQAACLHLSCRM